MAFKAAGLVVDTDPWHSRRKGPKARERRPAPAPGREPQDDTNGAAGARLRTQEGRRMPAGEIKVGKLTRDFAGAS
jgi:hypothetical protein